ncbi:MAG: tRNA pseudouridine(55) synthase TruB [Bacillota bacterium]
MNGGFIVLKPPGMTSHDVVAVVRRLTGVRRVGHSGTLDPAAAGVLPTCVGPAVRLVEYLQEGRKVYRCRLILGVTTDTQDATGQELRRRPVTGSREELAAVLPEFTGSIEQVPPMYSSLKSGGQTLHKLARRGVEVDRPPRRVTIHDLTLLDYARTGETARAILEVVCSKGTYVRTLCADIGERLGAGGHMGFLVRLETGGYRADEAVTLEELSAARERGELSGFLHPAAELLRGWPEMRVGPDEAMAVTTGRWRSVSGRLINLAARPPGEGKGPTRADAEPLAKVTCQGELVAIGRLKAGPTGDRPLVWVEKAFPRGNEG